MAFLNLGNNKHSSILTTPAWYYKALEKAEIFSGKMPIWPRKCQYGRVKHQSCEQTLLGQPETSNWNHSVNET